MLKHFAVDISRRDLVVDMQFYQMNLKSVVETALESEIEALKDDTSHLPCWSKFGANPVKAKGFFVNMLQAVFLNTGKASDDSLNVDYQTGRSAADGIKVAMIFLPGSTTNANLLEIVPIAEQALRGFKIVAVSGAADMTNATAERRVKDAIEIATSRNQHVLIISAVMAQRSFSIPEITELYLAYDNGDNGATIQKTMRTATPHRVGKIGRVISLSFDPNRDDKFDSMLIEAAQNYKRNTGSPDLKTALRDVLRTLDMFRCQANGAVKIEIDTYLEEALGRNSIDRLVGKVARLDELSPEQIRAIAQGKAEVFRAAKVEAAQRGKTRSTKLKIKRGNANSDASLKDIQRAREVITTIAQNIDIIRYYGGSTIEESFSIMDAEGDDIQDDVTEQFGVDYELVKSLILDDIINRDLLDLKFI